MPPAEVYLARQALDMEALRQAVEQAARVPVVGALANVEARGPPCTSIP